LLCVKFQLKRSVEDLGQIDENQIVVNLKKKRNLPLILETMKQNANINYSFLNGKKLQFEGATYS